MKALNIFAGIALTAAFSLVSCQTSELMDIQEAPVSKGSDHIAAALPMTRTTNSGFKTLWQLNDGIRIFHAPTGSDSAYVYDGIFRIREEGVTSGVFDGTFGEMINPEVRYDWYAFHPGGTGITSPKGEGATNAVGANIQVPSATGSTSHMASTSCPLWGQVRNLAGSDSITFEMKHLCAAAKITVKNTTGNYIRIHSLEIIAPEMISGPFTIDISGDTPAFSSTTAYNNVLVHTPFDGVLMNGSSADYYAAFKPFTVHEGETLIVRVNGYEKKFVATSAIEFKSGHIQPINFNYDLPAKDFSGEYFLAGVGPDSVVYAASGKYAQCGLYDGSGNTNTVLLGHNVRLDGDKVLYDSNMNLVVKETIEDYKFIVEKETSSPIYSGMYTIKTPDGLYIATTSSSVNQVATQSSLDSNCYWDIADCGDDCTYIVATLSENHRRLAFNYNNGNYPRFTCFADSWTNFVLPRLIPFGTPEVDPLPRFSVTDIETDALPVEDDTVVVSIENNHAGWQLGVQSYTGCVSNAWTASGAVHYSLSENLNTEDYAYGTIVVTLSNPLTETSAPLVDTVYVTQGRSKKIDPSKVAVIKIGGCGELDNGNHMTYLPGIDYNFSAPDYNDNNNVTTGTPAGAGRMYTEDDFNYEIFAQIEAGANWYLYTGDSATPDSVYVPDASFESATTLVQVPFADLAAQAKPVETTAVYRLRYSSITKEFIMQKLGNDNFPNGAALREWISGESNNSTQSPGLTYVGNGVWKWEGFTPARKVQRGYKFLVFGLPQDQPYGFMNRGQEGFTTFDLSSELPAFPGDYWKVCSVKGGVASLVNGNTTPRNGTWPEFNTQFTSTTWNVYLWLNDSWGAYMHYVGPDSQPLAPTE